MFTEIETSDDFKCSRFTLNLNFDDQSCEPIVQKAFQINFPKDKCRNLKSQIFEEHEMSFEQFTQFDTITDLDFLKRELLDFSEDLLIKDEENFADNRGKKKVKILKITAQLKNLKTIYKYFYVILFKS